MSFTPMTVTVTGAAGQIGYALLFRIASGQIFGKETPINLRLLEVPQGVRMAEGAAMELEDCAFPLLREVNISDDPNQAFQGTNVALLVGARPRTRGMERSDLLEANGRIFAPQGQAINAHAASDVRVLVVGNPANTNALIVAANAPDIPRDRITAMTRLDHNRAVSQVAKKLGVSPSQVHRMTIWGNHSVTQYPDVSHVQVVGVQRPTILEDKNWLVNDFIPTVATRGAAIIDARGASSAASAANAVVDHVYDWAHTTAPGDWTSAGLISQGWYGIPEGLVCSVPVVSNGRNWNLVEGLEISDFSRTKIDASVAELIAEREAVRALGLI